VKLVEVFVGSESVVNCAFIRDRPAHEPVARLRFWDEEGLAYAGPAAVATVTTLNSSVPTTLQVRVDLLGIIIIY
jgi:hypothetical protein